MFCCSDVHTDGLALPPLQDPDFAEVLTDLNSRELFWLSRGQLEIAVETEGRDPRRISGLITGRKSCDSKGDTVARLSADQSMNLSASRLAFCGIAIAQTFGKNIVFCGLHRQAHRVQAKLSTLLFSNSHSALPLRLLH